jgi:hypothetical protein
MILASFLLISLRKSELPKIRQLGSHLMVLKLLLALLGLQTYIGRDGGQSDKGSDS